MTTARLILATVLLVMGTLASLPSAEATASCAGLDGNENYEDYTSFAPPPSNCLYTPGVYGTVSTTQHRPGSGSKSFLTTADAGSRVTLAGGNFCTTAQRTATGSSLGFDAWFYPTQGTSGSGFHGVGMGNSGGSNPNAFAGVGFDAGGNWGVRVNSNSGGGQVNSFTALLGGAPLVTLNQWYQVQLVIICGPTGSVQQDRVSGSVTISGTTYGAQYIPASGQGWPSTGVAASFGIAAVTDSSATGSFIAYLDDWSVEGYTPDADENNIFCSDIGITNFNADPDADFGYNYVEDVDIFSPDQGSGPGDLTDGYSFSGNSGDYSYMGKGWTPGSKALRVNFTIESATEGQSSVFRAAFSEVSGTPSSSTKGNGDNTGAFAQHLAVRFREVGNDWRIDLEEVQSTGGTTSELGPSFLGYTPNSARSFTLWVDTRTTALGPSNSAFGSNGGSIQAGSYIAVTTPNENLPDADNQIILYQRLSSFWDNDLLLSQWFVGADVNGAPLNARTFLDDNDAGQDDQSTCIFTMDGAASVSIGARGTIGGSSGNDGDGNATSGCTTVFCVDSSTVPTGFTVAAFNGFLGLILMATITVGGVSAVGADTGKVKGLGIAVAAFAVIGYLIGLYFGLLPLWPVVAAVVIAGAVVFVRFKSGG